MGRSNVELKPLQVVAEFVAAVRSSDETIFVGIDPGSNGAIGLLCGRTVAVIDIPNEILPVQRVKRTTKKEFQLTGKKSKTVQGTTTTFDYAGICAVFRILREVRERIVIALETAPPSLGPGKHHAEVILNRAWAMWPLFLYSKGYSLDEVMPSVWKHSMGLSGKNKAYSRRKALALWPKAPLKLVKHHDRAEALLLAEYTRRKYLGGAA